MSKESCDKCLMHDSLLEAVSELKIRCNHDNDAVWKEIRDNKGVYMPIAVVAKELINVQFPNLVKKVDALDRGMIVDTQSLKSIHKRVDGIQSDIRKVVWLVVGAVLIAVLKLIMEIK